MSLVCVKKIASTSFRQSKFAFGRTETILSFVPPILFINLSVMFRRLRPRIQPLSLPLYISFLTEKAPVSYTFYWQMVPLSHTQFKTLHPFKQLRMHCLLNKNKSQNYNFFVTVFAGIKRNCWPFWAFLQAEMTYFPTLSSNSASETLTLSCTWSLKASYIGHCMKANPRVFDPNDNASPEVPIDDLRYAWHNVTKPLESITFLMSLPLLHWCSISLQMDCMGVIPIPPLININIL